MSVDSLQITEKTEGGARVRGGSQRERSSNLCRRPARLGQTGRRADQVTARAKACKMAYRGL